MSVTQLVAARDLRRGHEVLVACPRGGLERVRVLESRVELRHMRVVVDSGTETYVLQLELPQPVALAPPAGGQGASAAA